MILSSAPPRLQFAPQHRKASWLLRVFADFEADGPTSDYCFFEMVALSSVALLFGLSDSLKARLGYPSQIVGRSQASGWDIPVENWDIPWDDSSKVFVCWDEAEIGAPPLKSGDRFIG
jgi:hypothetical protein